MKMQRYHARDTRQALARIRAELGEDAVILSTQRTAEGVVVCAAVDFDFSAPLEAPPASEPAPAPAPRVAPVATAEPGTPDFANELRVARDGYGTEPARLGSFDAAPQLGEEIRSLRSLLETQVAALAWNDFTRREPVRARILADLTAIGIARDIALGVVEELPERIDDERASRLPLAHLARRIATTTSPALEDGGVLALVGPNGVGKTVTLAKFATRWVLDRGPREIALVTTDRDRFGAQEQLQALGRVLGVQTFAVEGPDALAPTLERIGDRRLVLVDTAGVNPRAQRVPQELGALATLRHAEIALVLSASTQGGALDAALAGFAALRPAHCILTKVDEAATLGGALSALATTRLPVSWVCQGPRIPQDIQPARAHQLVAHAATLARKSGACADEDLLARRFGGLIHAAA